VSFATNLFFLQICSHYQQLGGSDQWGNITAGIDLIRKLTGTADNKVSKAFGLTLPLITNSSGEKFGKSAGNAVWMDHGKTSFFNFYQFFVRIPDTEVPKLLKLYTFLPDDRIQEILRHHEVCGFVVLWFWPVSAPLFPSQIERARETGGPNSTGRGSYSPGAWRYDGHLLFDCFFFLRHLFVLLIPSQFVHRGRPQESPIGNSRWCFLLRFFCYLSYC